MRRSRGRATAGGPLRASNVRFVTPALDGRCGAGAGWPTVGPTAGSRRAAPGQLRFAALLRCSLRRGGCDSSAPTLPRRRIDLSRRSACGGLPPAALRCSAAPTGRRPATPHRRRTGSGLPLVENLGASRKGGGGAPGPGMKKPAPSSAAGAGGALARWFRMSEALYSGPSLRNHPRTRAAQGSPAAGRTAASARARRPATAFARLGLRARARTSRSPGPASGRRGPVK